MSPPTRSIYEQLGLSAMLKDDEVIDDSSEDDLVQEVIDPARLNNQAEGVVQPDQNTGMDQRLEDLELEEDEQLLLGPRVRPTDSPLFICKFPILQEVPQGHLSTWATAWGEMLTRWERTETQVDTNRALMWLGFLAQAPSGSPPGAAGRAGGRWPRGFSVWTRETGRNWSSWGRKTPNRIRDRRQVRRVDQEQEYQAAQLRKGGPGAALNIL